MVSHHHLLLGIISMDGNYVMVRMFQGNRAFNLKTIYTDNVNCNDTPCLGLG